MYEQYGMAAAPFLCSPTGHPVRRAPILCRRVHRSRRRRPAWDSGPHDRLRSPSADHS